MRPITEWCGVCLQDELKVIAVQVIEQVPLCKGCVVAYGDEKDVLRDAREFLRDLDADEPKQNAIPDFMQPEPAPPTVKHLCVCGCRQEVLEGTRLIAGHVDPTVPPGPTRHHREPDKPLTKEQREELLGTPVKKKQEQAKMPSTKMQVFNAQTSKLEPDKPTVPAGWTDEDEEYFEAWEKQRHTVYALFKTIKNYSQVAKQTGVSYSKVYSWCRALEKEERANGALVIEKENAIKTTTTRKEIRAQVVETQETETYHAGSPRVSRLHVDMPSGGRLSLEWEGHLFEISSEDRNFIFQISDRMRSYAKQKAVPLPPKHFSILGSVEAGYITDMLDCLDQDEQNRVVEWVAEAVAVVKERRGELPRRT